MPESQDLTSQDLSIEWLRRTVVLLLADASSGAEKDHAACAKYAEILFKILPRDKGDGASLQESLQQIREQIAREKKGKAETST